LAFAVPRNEARHALAATEDQDVLGLPVDALHERRV
jgi:hypothetical protein